MYFYSTIFVELSVFDITKCMFIYNFVSNFHNASFIYKRVSHHALFSIEDEDIRMFYVQHLIIYFNNLFIKQQHQFVFTL